MARLVALQPQVDLLEKRLSDLKGEKRCEEDPAAFLDADINAFKEHYSQVLEDLRARERQLQLGKGMQRRWVSQIFLFNPFFICHHQVIVHWLNSYHNSELFIKSALNATASSSLVLQITWRPYQQCTIKATEHFTRLPSGSLLNDISETFTWVTRPWCDAESLPAAPLLLIPTLSRHWWDVTQKSRVQ